MFELGQGSTAIGELHMVVMQAIYRNMLGSVHSH